MLVQLKDSTMVPTLLFMLHMFIQIYCLQSLLCLILPCNLALKLVSSSFLFRDLYHTEIVGIDHGSSSLQLGAQGGRVRRIVFDSGSSYTYFTKEAYTDLVDSVCILIHVHTERLQFMILL